MSTKTVAEKPNQGTEQNVHVPLKSWIAVFGGALGAFMAVLDIQITNSSLANIQGALGATLDEGTWIATSYLVAEIVTIPLTAWLSKVFSPRLYVLTNAILFIIFSMLCGNAHDLNSMIAFRALQGFTGGTLIPMAFTIILTNLPPVKRPIGMALFAVTATFAPSVGPAIGGWLTFNFGWEYIFYLNLLPGLLLIAMLAWSLPKEPMQLSLLKQGDWLGVITMAIGLSSLEVVLEEGNRKDWFGSPVIATLAVVAAVFLTIFLINELTCKRPLINLKLLLRRNFGFGSIANIALGAGLYGSIYLMPVYLAQVQHYNAQQIGQVLIWMGLPQLLIIPFVPKLMQKIDSRLMVAFGLSLFALSCFMNSFMSFDNGGDQMTVTMLIRALGQPMIMVPLSTLSTGEIEPAQAASASALFNMLRNLGGSIGIAAFSTFLSRREQFHSFRIGESLTATSLFAQERLNALTQSLINRGADLVTAQQQALQLLDSIVRREAFLMAFNDSFLLLSLLLMLSCATVALLKKAAPAGGGGAGAH